MIALVPHCDPDPAPQPLSNCPDCDAELALLRIIPGKAGAEYWTLRCTRCGGIHLDIVKGKAAVPVPKDAGDVHV